MSAGWVGASVRARAMSRRRIGIAGARSLAACTSLEEALEVLRDSPYAHDARIGQDLGQAQWAVASTLLWHTRILAGWVPRGDSRQLRILAGGFEVANVDERLRELAGAPAEPPFRLGSLATAWTALARATSPADLRGTLARSAWGDPGTDSPDGIRLAMRLSWATRVATSVPPARPWAAGAAVLAIARARFATGVAVPPGASLAVTALLGPRWPDAVNLTDLAARVPPEARWALQGVADPGDLWRAEAGWWSRVSGDGFTLLRRPVTTSDPVLGALLVLAADAWRVRAALEVAVRGGGSTPEAMGAFDAVA